MALQYSRFLALNVSSLEPEGKCGDRPPESVVLINRRRQFQSANPYNKLKSSSCEISRGKEHTMFLLCTQDVVVQVFAEKIL